MIVTNITMRHFRNHTDTSLHFGGGINAILGDNGQGKTNVLEAISYLGLTKSFYAASDQHAIQRGCAMFEIKGTVQEERGHTNQIRVVVTRAAPEKSYTINNIRPEKLSTVIGLFPVVVLSPENNAITFGGPAERRKFIDLILSEVSARYLADVLEYRRVLRQRNRLLTDAKLRGAGVRGIIEPWDESLISYGSRIIHRRAAFVEEFSDYVRRAYRDLVKKTEEPHIAYVSSCNGAANEGENALAERFRQLLDAHSEEERRRGVTLVGPHRDELALSIDGISAQQYASQGQHKTLLVALKVAEFFYLKERKQEAPILLLDDVFSELDAHRAAHILGFVADLSQSIVTATDERAFLGSVTWNDRHRRFRVDHGTVQEG